MLVPEEAVRRARGEAIRVWAQAAQPAAAGFEVFDADIEMSAHRSATVEGPP